jgi:hypothetical protein
MTDLCTIVFGEELEILKLQARSIDRYCSDIGTIYVIVNDDQSLCKSIDTAEYGQYQDRVQILHRSVFGSAWSDNGWVSQQALKLACAAISQNDWCVALDAKTIFVNPLPNMIQHDRVCVGTLPIFSVFEPSRQIVNQLWNIDLRQQLGPGGVPFWFNPTQVRAMIADIEQRKKSNFISWFQEQGMLTEFLLYSGWIEYQQGIDTAVAPCKISVQNLCHTEVSIADQKLSAMNNSTTVSIHRKAWPQLTVQQQQRYQSLLEQRLK